MAKDHGHKRQGQGPRTQTQVFSKKEKVFKNFFLAIFKKKKKKKRKVFKKIFQAISKKTVQKKIFQPIYKILTIQKLVLSSSRGQANFRGLEASRPRPRT